VGCPHGVRPSLADRDHMLTPPSHLSRTIHALAGHSSTVRCVRVLHHRPIAVSGARDGTVRVWDIRRGRALRVLHGHQDSVRALDVCGSRAVSGSYDATCRVWDVDTGECVHVLRGHFHQIYTVAFDGVHVASAGLDTTVRVWDAETGWASFLSRSFHDSDVRRVYRECIVLLQGHTALVCTLQLCTAAGFLATGGSDGRVLTFSLPTASQTPPLPAPNPAFAPQLRIPAHDSSVTALHASARRLVSGGADGRVRVFRRNDGAPVREIGTPMEVVWKVAVGGGVLGVAGRRAGKMVVELWAFSAEGEEPLAEVDVSART
jgi:F-box and WD-40 domain protein CDC4